MIVPGLDTLASPLPVEFTARACTCHVYDVLASRGCENVNAVSFSLSWNRSRWPVRVLNTEISYSHRPGGRVIGGLLQTNSGDSVWTTVVGPRIGATRRSQLRTGCCA